MPRVFSTLTQSTIWVLTKINVTCNENLFRKNRIISFAQTVFGGTKFEISIETRKLINHNIVCVHFPRPLRLGSRRFRDGGLSRPDDRFAGPSRAAASRPSKARARFADARAWRSRPRYRIAPPGDPRVITGNNSGLRTRKMFFWSENRAGQRNQKPRRFCTRAVRSMPCVLRVVVW